MKTPPPGAPPPSIGPFEILSELGRGAMGVVYKARHTVLGRPVALKFILGGAGAPVTERALREARTAARMGKHPNIVQVFEAGQIEGRSFIAMELIEGDDLGKMVRRDGPMHEVKAMEHIRKMALALDHAHRRGIVHRDIKPSNVIVDADGEPQLTDFGLAFDVEGARLTGEGEIVGTPEYMSPEQVNNERSRIGAHTDVYALGATLFDLIAGRAPYQGTAVSVLTQVITDDPPRLRTVRPKASLAVEAVIAKALERRPEDRYQTALELADDLGRVLSGDAPRVRPPTPVDALRRFARRHRTAVATGLVAFGFVAVAVAVLVVQGIRARARREAAILRSVEAMVAEGSDKRIAKLRESIALDPTWPTVRVQLADALYSRGIEHYHRGENDAYVADLEESIASTEAAMAHGAEAASVYLAATMAEYIGEKARAIALLRRVQGLDAAGFWGLAAQSLAGLLEGQFEEADRAATAAIAIDPSDSTLFFRRSVARLAIGNLEGAAADANRPIESFTSDDWSLTQRARVHLARGDLRLAAIDLVEALRHYPDSWVAYEGLAALARREGAAARAEALEARARSVSKGRAPAYLSCRDVPWGALVGGSTPAAEATARSRARLAARDAEGALDAAAAAVERSPADPEALRARAAAFRALGRIKDAEEDERWAARLSAAPGEK